MSGAQVTSFLTYFTPGNPNYGNFGQLMNLFSANNPTAPPFTSPIVGITDHAVPGTQVIGPGFVGQSAIQMLFQQLFMCFNPLRLADIGAPWMTSSDNATSAVRLTLSGTQTGAWFAQGNPGGTGYSLPLSEIRHIPQGPATSTIPACAVFTFDQGDLINELAFYMDRYKTMRDLQPQNLTSFDHQMTTFLRHL